MVGKHSGSAAGQHTPADRFESGADLQSALYRNSGALQIKRPFDFQVFLRKKYRFQITRYGSCQSGTETLDSRTDGTNTGQYRSGYNGAVLKTVQRREAHGGSNPSCPANLS